MKLQNSKVILRNLISSDIEDMIKWQRIETEWQLWDAPWENSDKFNAKEYRKKLTLSINKRNDENKLKNKFQICINDELKTHIGWCNAYKIDKNFNYTTLEGDYTIGIYL